MRFVSCILNSRGVFSLDTLLVVRCRIRSVYVDGGFSGIGVLDE